VPRSLRLLAVQAGHCGERQSQQQRIAAARVAAENVCQGGSRHIATGEVFP